MDNIITTVSRVNAVLGTLRITSSRDNLDKILGCMQALDQVIEALNELNEKEAEPDAQTDAGDGENP